MTTRHTTNPATVHQHLPASVPHRRLTFRVSSSPHQMAALHLSLILLPSAHTFLQVSLPEQF